MIFVILFLIFLVILFLWVLSLVISAFSGAPTVYTSRKVIREVLMLAGAKRGESLTDLGCGNARSLIIAAKEFGMKGTGIEISPFYCLLAKLNVLVHGEHQNIKIYFGNFRNFKSVINKSDLIYIYLFPKLVTKNEKWIFENKKTGSRVVCLAFPFSRHKTISEVKTPPLFLYS